MEIKDENNQPKISLDKIPDIEKIEILVARIRCLVEYHAKDRGHLSQQVSELLEENANLKQKLENLEPSSSKYHHEPTELERELGLDFSI
ncbi:hypothetical protein ACT3OH_15460 [Vreelandella zhanjiangensis]|uniref:hypothetical protein n=1 Tax=Vreelandella zhanjiangensis TaxID=1121960 RepID=UPI00402A9D48